ncbi:MAG: GxxExxY protein, partial [Candidatus Uhrbacteria bacterium]|nr:GxxExxY protein [Candidatus Uhrbacteria bacterium]
GLKEKGLTFQEQVYFPVEYHQKIVGKKFLDFLIEGKIILEMKQGKRFGQQNIQQVVSYLESGNLQLAILTNFTPQGVLFRRLVNIPSDPNS